jgi:transcriptional regulator with XRE-family HTH domain
MAMSATNKVEHDDESLVVTIGTRVAGLLWQKRLTQVQLASKLGVDKAGIARRMRGVTAWSVSDLQTIAHELGTSVAYLVGEVDNAEWAPSGSNRRPADYKYDGLDALELPQNDPAEEHELRPVIPIERAFEIRAQGDAA